MTRPESDKILFELSEKGSIKADELINEELKDKDKINKAINEMVKENILRYSVDGTITWHGRVQATKFRKYRERGQMAMGQMGIGRGQMSMGRGQLSKSMGRR